MSKVKKIPTRPSSASSIDDPGARDESPVTLETESSTGANIDAGVAALNNLLRDQRRYQQQHHQAAAGKGYFDHQHLSRRGSDSLVDAGGFTSNDDESLNTDSALRVMVNELTLQNRILESKLQDERRQRQRAEDEVKFVKHKMLERDQKLEQQALSLRKSGTAAAEMEKEREAHRAAVAALKVTIDELRGNIVKLEAQVKDAASNSNNAAAATAGPTNSALNSRRGSTAVSFPVTPVTVVPTPPSTQPPASLFSPQFHHPGGGAASGSAATSLMMSGSASESPSLSSFASKRTTELLDERLRTMKLTRENKLLRAKLQTLCCNMEQKLMAEADHNSVYTHRCLARGMVPINDALKEEQQERPLDDLMNDKAPTGTLRRRHSQPMISFENMRRYGRGDVRELPFREKLDLKTPDERYIDAKVKASAFGPQVQTMREQIHAFAHEWKDAEDKCLSSLLYIFGEAEKKGGGLLSCPKEDFNKELRSALLGTKRMIFDLVKRVNDGIKGIMNNEKKIKLQWFAEAVPRSHMCVQADIPPPEDPRIAALNERVEFLTSRQQQLRDDFHVKSDDLDMKRSKAECNMRFLQQKVVALHEAVYHALHAVYKHRFHWAPRCPNNFFALEKNADDKRQLEVGYNVNLADAIDQDIALLAKFTEYFVSDEVFGADLSGAANLAREAAAEQQQENAGIVRRRDSVPVKKRIYVARRLSNQLEHFLKNEKGTPSDATTPVEATEPNPQLPRPHTARGEISSSEPSPTCDTAVPPPQGSQSAHKKPKLKPRDPAPTTTPEGFKRLEDWQNHQRELWEAKRRTCMGPPPVVVWQNPVTAAGAASGVWPSSAHPTLSPATVNIQFDGSLGETPEALPSAPPTGFGAMAGRRPSLVR